MTGHGFEVLNTQVKFWMPYVSAAGFLIGMYYKATRRVTTWANKLMGNHMVHLQQSLDRLEAAQTQQLDHSSVQSDQLIAQTELLRQVVSELRTPAVPPAQKRPKYSSAKIKR